MIFCGNFYILLPVAVIGKPIKNLEENYIEIQEVCNNRLNSMLDIYLKVEDKGEDFLLLFDAAIMNEMSVLNKIESDIHSNLLLLPSEIAVNEFSYSGYPLMPVIRDALNNKDNFEDIKRILSSLSIEDLGDITQEDKRLALNNKLRQIKADLAELPKSKV